jgi:hypothetical protein
MPSDILYTEKLTSTRTLALFAALMVLFGGLFAWRLVAGSPGFWGIVFGFFFCLFLFYTLNFRTLSISLTPESLVLTFGVFTWRVPLGNIAGCRLDDVPPFKKYGGAGIHFMFVHKRYRASFNFLEYPRVVIAFKQAVGPVRDLSFSTRRPGLVLHQLKQAVALLPPSLPVNTAG